MDELGRAIDELMRQTEAEVIAEGAAALVRLLEIMAVAETLRDPREKRAAEHLRTLRPALVGILTVLESR